MKGPYKDEPTHGRIFSRVYSLSWHFKGESGVGSVEGLTEATGGLLEGYWRATGRYGIYVNNKG